MKRVLASLKISETILQNYCFVSGASDTETWDYFTIKLQDNMRELGCSLLITRGLELSVH